MANLETIESQLNRAKAQLDQLCTSFHFSAKDVRDLAPQMALNIRYLQKQYNHAITTGAKDTEVAEAVPITNS